MLTSLFETLHELPLAEMIRESPTAFPWIESVHVLSITLVLGSIAVVDLRLLGLASMRRPVTTLTRQVLPLTWIAFAFAAITGFLMFISNAVEYSRNLPFQMKMALMGVAGINMVAFHFITSRSVGSWNESPRTPLAARIAGGLSVSLWLAIVAFGRWIGFTIGF